MRISDWSSDVCSSDLIALILQDTGDQHADVGFVVDDEDFVSHALQLFPQPASRCRRPPARRCCRPLLRAAGRSEEHTSELQSLMRISYAVFCLKKKK